MVVAVTGLEPQTDPNTAQAHTVPIASAPGSRRSHSSAARNRLAPMPVVESTSPIRMNNGTTTRMKLLDSEKADDASWLMALGDTNIAVPAMATVASATPTGVRVASSARRHTRKIAKLPNAPINAPRLMRGRSGCHLDWHGRRWQGGLF